MLCYSYIHTKAKILIYLGETQSAKNQKPLLVRVEKNLIIETKKNILKMLVLKKYSTLEITFL